MSEVRVTAHEVRDAWRLLTLDARLEAFHLLDRPEAERFFLELSVHDQASLLLAIEQVERRMWIRLLAPDDAADLIQNAPEDAQRGLLELLDASSRIEVSALLAYSEDAAGGLMSPRFARLRPEMSAAEAIHYLQHQTREKLETIYYAYVLDSRQRLEGVLSFRDLFTAPPEMPVSEVMRKEVISVPDTLNQEAVARLIARHDLNAIPVVDEAGQMKGIVTVDDIVDVVEEAATEDIHKLGGLEALDTPYMQTGLLSMIRKRGGWLSALFVGEMLTASAMARYEDQIAQAVVLALFVPLIISSGGNSGSQATTLIIRAMALGEVTAGDWWRIIQREFVAGLALGVLLAGIGAIRILVWQSLFQVYGDHHIALAVTIALSLIGVVTWGTLAGSMLPFIIRSLGLDPASASAPFVATLVDVSGLVIYFSVAQVVLRGSLL